MGNMYMLVASTNRGRYALDTSDGVDVTAGTRLAVLISGCWIWGMVEHGRVYSGEDGGIKRGYYFLADDGGSCGLCVGMQVQVC
jgi:Domain of unknown function (DUF5348)